MRKGPVLNKFQFSSLGLLFCLLYFAIPQVATAQSGDSMDSMPSMMPAFYGDYAHMRESSGTAWQPDSSPMHGYMFSYDNWSMMVHGYTNGIYDNQGGMRGSDKGYSTNMAMFMASRKVGDGTLGFRSMLSLEPLMGKRGYPELLQTGETADGSTPLIDRQHPHDLFMELAATYSYPLARGTSAFFYGGIVGEPALGPPTFMHRMSGVDIPDAPITHHWLDSTHITEGVITGGFVLDNVKLESSIFNGREPDEYRYDIEARPLDSYSFRTSYNFADNWSSQVSYGYLNSPEQLEHGVSQQRLTASLIYNRQFGDDNNWATTAAWGQDINNPGLTLNAYLLESTISFYRTHTVFGRFEAVKKDELFDENETNFGRAVTVGKLALGYIYDFAPIFERVQLGIGGEGSIDLLPGSVRDEYGTLPFSYLLFVRAKII